jgi:hypothetical protein
VGVMVVGLHKVCVGGRGLALIAAFLVVLFLSGIWLLVETIATVAALQLHFASIHYDTQRIEAQQKANARDLQQILSEQLYLKQRLKEAGR